VVEGMLDTTGLSDLFFSNKSHGYKKGTLTLLPVVMDDRISRVFEVQGSRAAFKLEYVYFDFKDKPSAYGWFIIPPEKMPMVSQVGVWNDEK
jgi:GntR family transcriptional regulator